MYIFVLPSTFTKEMNVVEEKLNESFEHCGETERVSLFYGKDSKGSVKRPNKR